MIVVPACPICNAGASAIEEEFRNLVVMVAGPGAAADTYKAFVRSINRLPVRRTQIASRLSRRGKDLVYGEMREKYRGILIKMVKGLYYQEFGQPIPRRYFLDAWLGPPQTGHQYHHVANTTTRVVTPSFTYRFMGDQETSAWWLEWYGKVEVLALVRRPDFWSVADWVLRKLTGGTVRLPT